ncbi:transmembrane protein 136-like isoform X2 [Acanthaster planci]|nr:transmembrane protein 136-like isoform X2 [Acanthaster planci]XP_022086084.1 transmembrane protein 136-like isoform X2 [Acanthaster planci]XP_022086086.1 transmembrane protein 136-like isoform X2 [Acanthaster planci]XP_022086087.1 transmembrane protein 136-like isoform X2 [Acanthaster planci]XP_022086088.1 transmembrane protein 136-like isoform X2 [Acanthaster planci]XP_022086089.1 transmembrane protein 136-like isoform X2 [Acanthaster planci]
MELTAGLILLLTLTAFVLWSALYGLFCWLQPHRSYEWNCRVVVSIHAVTVLSLSSTFGALYNPWPFTHPGGKSNIYEIVTMIVCLGFFLFDVCWCVWFFDEETKIMIVHHLVSIIGIFASLITGLSGTEVGTCIFLAELTNPMLQFRWFMRSSGVKDGWLYELNDFLFMMMFAVCRCGIGTFFLYRYTTHPRPKLFFKVGGLALYLVSMVFFGQILVFAYHKYRKMYQRWRYGDKTKIDGDKAR